MFGVVIVSQGGVARELLDAGRRIAGELAGFRAVSLAWEDGIDASREKIRRAIQEVDRGEGALVLVDMFGSTPCNAALGLLDPGHVEIVTGVNLPMVVRLGCSESTGWGVGEAAGWLQDKVQRSICRPTAAAGSAAAPAPCEEPSPEGGG